MSLFHRGISSIPLVWYQWSSSFPPFRKSLTLEWRGRDLMSSTTNQHLTFFLSLFPPLAKESFSIWNLQCLFYLLWPSKVHPCIALGPRHRRLLPISFPLQLHIHALSCPEDIFLMIQKNNFFYLLCGVLDALSLQLFVFFSPLNTLRYLLWETAQPVAMIDKTDWLEESPGKLSKLQNPGSHLRPIQSEYSEPWQEPISYKA